MSDIRSTSGNDADDELQNALAAAFGDDALQWLSDDTAELFGEGSGDSPADAAPAQELIAAISPPATADGNPQGAATDVEPLNGTSPPPDQQRQISESPGEGLSFSAPRYIICQIDNRQFGLPLDGVTEIVRQATITPLPRTPSWLRGVTNLRGQIVSVVELRELWNATNNPHRQSARERIVVVHNSTADASTAIVVDQILGITSCDGDHEFDSRGNETLPEIAGGLISVDQTPIVLIDPDRLLGCAELQKFAI